MWQECRWEWMNTVNGPQAQRAHTCLRRGFLYYPTAQKWDHNLLRGINHVEVENISLKFSASIECCIRKSTIYICICDTFSQSTGSVAFKSKVTCIQGVPANISQALQDKIKNIRGRNELYCHQWRAALKGFFLFIIKLSIIRWG